MFGAYAEAGRARGDWMGIVRFPLSRRVRRVWSERERRGAARELVWQAISSLVVDKPIQERLGYALRGISLLAADRAAQQTMSNDLRAPFAEIHKELIAHRAGGETAPPTVELSGEEANRLARKIVELYVDLNDGI